MADVRIIDLDLGSVNDNHLFESDDGNASFKITAIDLRAYCQNGLTPQSIGIAAGVTITELNYLDGVTSGVQGQIDGKVSTSVTINTASGLTGGGSLVSNRTISLDVPSLANKATPSSSDQVLIYDPVSLSHKRTTVSGITSGLSGGGNGVTAHGALTGLNSDDHPQYSLADGSRWTTTPTANRVVVSGASGNIIVSSITTTILGYLSSVSSDIQIQLNEKATITSVTTVSNDLSALTTVVAGKQNTLGFTPENISNKATNLTSSDNTKYPTTLAVSNAISGITKSTLGLSLVENTALSTWAGSTNLATLGTIITGTWNGTAINDTYISSASVWNNKQNTLVSGTTIKTVNSQSLLGSGDITISGSVAWGNVTGTLSSQADLLAALNAKQNTITNSDSIVQGTTNLFLSSAERTKLTGIQAGAEINVNADWNAVSGDAQILNKPTTLSGYGITDSQPLDSDLTAIAALTTTAFGRGILTQVDAPAIRTYIGAGTSSFDGNYNSLSNIPSTFTPTAHNQAWSTITGTPTTLAGYQISDAQPLDADLTAIAALATSAFGRGILTQVDAPAIRSYIGAGTSNFDGNYSSLSNIPSTFTPSSHNQAWATITSTPTTLSGYGITDAQPFITAGSTAQYYRGDKTFQTLDKTAVGLNLVDNTSDANKPISGATQTALDLKNKIITSGTAAPSGGADGDIYLQYT